jgi:hypothetical protein
MEEVQNVTRAENISLNTLYICTCIRISVTPSYGLVGAPDFFSGIAMGLIQTGVVKLCFNRAVLHPSLVC